MKFALAVAALAAVLTVPVASGARSTLTGPGVNKATSVSGTGKKTWNVTLKKGTYKYLCDVHSSIMHGSFKVK
jgi:plastocyanin